MENLSLEEKFNSIVELLKLQTQIATRRQEFPLLYKDFLKAKLLEELKSIKTNKIDYIKSEIIIPEYIDIDLEKYTQQQDSAITTRVNIYEWSDELKKINSWQSKLQHQMELESFNQNPLFDETI